MPITFLHAADIHLDSPLRGLERYEHAPAERIRGATDDILSGGVALVGELNGLPEALAVTDTTVKEVSVGAVRYAGSVAKLLG